MKIQIYFKYLLIFILVSCASGGIKDREKLRGFVAAKQFTKAHEFIEKSKFFKDEDSKLLYFLEKGMIFHAEGSYFQSTQVLNEAKKLSNLLYTKSFSGKGKALIANDNYDKYYGQVYERSLIYFYLSLNHYLTYLRGYNEAYTIQPKTSSEKPQEIAQKELTNSEKRTTLYAARAEILAWDSYLKSIKDERLGRSVYKSDLLAKTFGGFIHEAIGTRSDLQIALQLYKDANKLLFKNYGIYKTFNGKSVDFKKNFADFPKLGAKVVREKFYTDTDYSSQLDQFLDFKVLSLTQKLRPRDFKNQAKILNADKKIIEKAKKAKGRSNIGLVLQKGMIPPKVGEKQYISIDSVAGDSKAGKVVATIGKVALTAFAADKLGLLPPPNNWNPASVNLGVQVAAAAVDTAAISFELPRIQNAPNSEYQVVRVYDREGKKEVLSKIVPLINPLGDIAEESVAEESAWRYTRVGTRLALKHITAIAAAYGSYTAMASKGNGNDFMAKNIAVIQYLASAKAIEASEKADTRYWSTLPGNIHFTNLYLKPGIYKIKVETRKIGMEDKDSGPMKDFGEISVDGKSRQLLNYRL